MGIKGYSLLPTPINIEPKLVAHHPNFCSDFRIIIIARNHCKLKATWQI